MAARKLARIFDPRLGRAQLRLRAGASREGMR